MGKSATLTIDFPDKEVSRFKKAFNALGEENAPFLEEGLRDSGRYFANKIESHAAGGIARAVAFVGVKGTGAALRAVGKVTHPGAPAMEFGRTKYYRGFTGRSQKSGTAFRASPGQKAKPFIGIKTGQQATADTEPYAREKLGEAFAKEWDRILGGGS